MVSNLDELHYACEWITRPDKFDLNILHLFIKRSDDLADSSKIYTISLFQRIIIQNKWRTNLQNGCTVLWYVDGLTNKES